MGVWSGVRATAGGLTTPNTLMHRYGEHIHVQTAFHKTPPRPWFELQHARIANAPVLPQERIQ